MQAVRQAAEQRNNIMPASPLRRKLIAPSGRHYQLMREISGLGMDDPVSKAYTKQRRSSNTNTSGRKKLANTLVSDRNQNTRRFLLDSEEVTLAL